MSKLTVKNLESQAKHLWKVLLLSEISDGHSKSYDPLEIEKIDGGYRFHSYVFDYGDGGRHRNFSTLEEGQDWLLLSFKDWIDRYFEDKDANK